jgi:hypothetical protein
MNDQMPEIERAPIRRPVKKKAKKRVASARPEARAEAPVTRNSPRPAPPRAESHRDTAREPNRKNARIVVGRGGEELTRRRLTVGDAFDVPKNEVPTGWTYQWNTVTVLNQAMKEIERGDLLMHENGWRPVPASRHPGRWTPQGYEGSIIIDGLRLEERPESLTAWAKEEDEARGRALVRDRTDALRLTQKSLPGAREARQRSHIAGPEMGMRMSIDPALDIPHPELRLDDGSEFED